MICRLCIVHLQVGVADDAARWKAQLLKPFPTLKQVLHDERIGRHANLAVRTPERETGRSA